MLVRAFTYGALMLALLCLSYPPRSEFALGRDSFSYWLEVYVGMALIITAIGVSSVLLSTRLFRRSWLIRLAAALLTLAALAIYALAVGGVTAQTLEAMPLEALHTRFFREFRSVKFAFVVAPCAAALTTFLIRQRTRLRA